MEKAARAVDSPGSRRGYATRGCATPHQTISGACMPIPRDAQRSIHFRRGAGDSVVRIQQRRAGGMVTIPRSRRPVRRAAEEHLHAGELLLDRAPSGRRRAARRWRRGRWIRRLPAISPPSRMRSTPSRGPTPRRRPSGSACRSSSRSAAAVFARARRKEQVATASGRRRCRPRTVTSKSTVPFDGNFTASWPGQGLHQASAPLNRRDLIYRIRRGGEDERGIRRSSLRGKSSPRRRVQPICPESVDGLRRKATSPLRGVSPRLPLSGRSSGFQGSTGGAAAWSPSARNRARNSCGIPEGPSGWRRASALRA